MKRLLLPLLAAIALPTAVNADVDPKVAEICMKAVDFQGCVNAMTGNSYTTNSESCDDLKEGLAIVKERLISGTSLTKLDINTNPLSDALAKSKISNSSKNNCQNLVSDSQTILEMIRILRTQWNYEFDSGIPSAKQGKKVFPSAQVEANIKKFNLYAGGKNLAITGPGEITGFSDRTRRGFDYEIREWRGSLLNPCGVPAPCGFYVVKSPVNRMFDVIGMKIDAAIDGKDIDWREPPKIIEKVVEKKKEKKEVTKGSVKINCDSPVWKKKPICN